jgi:aminomethyltransferase
MPLYGNELDRDTVPAEAGLGRVVKLDKDVDFVGRGALEQAAERGPRKQLVGLELRDRGIARHGYPVYEPNEDEPGGVVTSGTLSPTLGTAIAMAYVPPASAAPGTMLEVGIRSTRVPAQVVPLPFYKRPAPQTTA